MPNSATMGRDISRMARVILLRPMVILPATSAVLVSMPASSSVSSNGRSVLRTTSMRSLLAITFRVSPSTMSSRRDCALRSSLTRW